MVLLKGAMASTTHGLLAVTSQPLARHHCHTLSVLDTAAVDRWISDSKSLTLTDSFTPNHPADLHITLPTRDGVGSHTQLMRHSHRGHRMP
ncbi:hypothetical protein EDD16DRAFT_1535423 [Pisolithus croceorrhizus]|nr:hypothetical protein EV401DRAFT_1931676 [Pisolithus croceorrhizus]KAI6132219.1 hypothetical protein EDD16DRAFT_1535423 [Pisolithus croceorrhizus]